MTVIAFKGTIPQGEPVPSLVEELERLLAEAKSGDLRALGYCTVRVNGVLGTGWDGGDGARYPLGAAVSMLQQRYTQDLLEGAKE